MKLPRNISGAELARALRKLGYVTTRQSGSHLRLTTSEHGQHHVTVPNHDPVKVGTLSGIIGDVARHFEISRDELIEQLLVHEQIVAQGQDGGGAAAL